MMLRRLWITLRADTQTHEITGACALFYRTVGVDKVLACVTRHRALSWSCATRAAQPLPSLARTARATPPPAIRPRQLFHRAFTSPGELRSPTAIGSIVGRARIRGRNSRAGSEGVFA